MQSERAGEYAEFVGAPGSSGSNSRRTTVLARGLSILEPLEVGSTFVVALRFSRPRDVAYGFVSSHALPSALRYALGAIAMQCQEIGKAGVSQLKQV